MTAPAEPESWTKPEDIPAAVLVEYLRWDTLTNDAEQANRHSEPGASAVYLYLVDAYMDRPDLMAVTRLVFPDGQFTRWDEAPDV